MIHGTPAEEWKPVTVPGFERTHEVSSLGGVRTVAGEILNQYDDGAFGYRRVQLYISKSKKKLIRVHRLVLEAFLGPCPPGLVTLHGPGGHLDNSLANLSYGTQAQNIQDKVRDGTDARGERSNFARLSEAQVREIRAVHAAGGITQRALAARYGVAQATVSRVVIGRTWAHITEQQEEVA